MFTLVVVLVILVVVVGAGLGVTLVRRRGGDRGEPIVSDRGAPSTARGATPPVAIAEAPPTAVPRVLDGALRRTSSRFRELRLRLGRMGLEELLAVMEVTLLESDLGPALTKEVLDEVRANAPRSASNDQLWAELRRAMRARLLDVDRSLATAPEQPTVMLVVGVNGVGKTTTIGKLAASLRDRGPVVIAAADTFRAAANEQVATWAERSGVALVSGQPGADPGSVVFDAIEHARARHAAVVIADTAGRLHTKTNLMAELGKIRRVAEKAAGHVDEVLLVIDATTGQNGLSQARVFGEVASITGVVLTKLDGSAKGGIALAIEHEFKVPIKLIGVGEGIDDLAPFDPDRFIDALLGLDEASSGAGA